MKASRIIKKISTLIEIKKRRLGRRKLFMQLKRDPDEDIQRLLSTLNFIIKENNWTYEEIEDLHKVDKLRNTYLASNEAVRIRDFGAGNLKTTLSGYQMNEGIDEITTISRVCKGASIPDRWGKLIFKVVREFKPDNCLELGTALGISAAYQIIALKLNNQGKLITIEGSEELANIADANLKNLQYPGYSVQSGRFKDVLANLLPEYQPVDFAFIDGHHDRIATKEYFEILYNALANRSILIFDDINWSKGMKEVWHEIYLDKRVKLSFDLHRWGICVIDKDNDTAGLRCYKTVI